MALLAMLAGCAGPGAGGGSADGGGPGTLAGTWQLETIGETGLHGGINAPTLIITADGNVSGFAGVNRVAGVKASEGPQLFGPLATTRMGGSGPAMELETRLLSVLQQADGYRVAGDTLVLQVEGEPAAQFRRVSPEDGEAAESR